MKRWNLLHSQMLGVGLAAFGMLLVGTSALMLYPLDEAKNAECAREMLGRGDWIVPTFNGELRTDKPPFHYWIMMLCYQFFGPTEWSARLGSVLSGVGTVLITFRFAWQYLGRHVAWGTATLLLASLHIGIQFRMAVPDPYLIFLMTLAFYSFFSWYQEQRTHSLYVFYAAIGVGMLAKGPIAVLLPTVAVVLFLWSAGRIDVLRRMHWWQGALLIMAMALPWYVAVDQTTQGAWTEGFLLKHNIGRFSVPMEGHGGIFLITILYVFVGLLPFSVFIPQAVHWSWQMRHNHQALLFCLTVAGVIVGFFCFSSTRLPNYTVPAYPFLAILVITYLFSFVKEHRSIRALRIPMVIYLVLAVLLPVALFLALYLDPLLRSLAGWSVIFLAFPLGAGVAWYFYRRAALRPMVGAMACSFMVTGLLFFGWLYPLIDRQNPVAQTLPVVRQAKQVVAYKLFNPAFIFYIGHPIPVYEQPDSLQKAVAQTPGLTVLSRATYLPELATVRSLHEVARQRDLFERPTTVVLRKVPSADTLSYYEKR